MVDISSDWDPFVKIEGIEIMTEYLSLLKKSHVESDYVPHVTKMIEIASDSITADEIRVRMAKLSGKILDRFS
jgi:hypothetical protein